MLAAGGGAGENIGVNARREAEGALRSKWKIPPDVSPTYTTPGERCIDGGVFSNLDRAGFVCASGGALGKARVCPVRGGARVGRGGLHPPDSSSVVAVRGSAGASVPIPGIQRRRSPPHALRVSSPGRLLGRRHGTNPEGVTYGLG